MNKARKRIGLLGVALCSLLAIPVYADRVDFLLGRAGYYDNLGLPMMSFWYDFRNPAARDGWSLACGEVVITDLTTGNMDAIYASTLLIRWRWLFTKSFGMDAILGGGVGLMPTTVKRNAITHVEIAFLPILFPMLGLNYTFENGRLLGIQCGFLGVLPFLMMVISLPVGVVKHRGR